jgi:hypothetical protein
MDPKVCLGYPGSPILGYEGSWKDASTETVTSMGGSMGPCVIEYCLQLCVCFMYD